jgi:hypothetical protein
MVIHFKADWRATGRNWSSFSAYSTDKRRFADDIVTHFGFCASRTVAGTEMTGRMTATTDYGNYETNFSKFYNPSEHFAVDEVTVKFKGRVIFKQYITKKTQKFWPKNVQCDSTGYT